MRNGNTQKQKPRPRGGGGWVSVWEACLHPHVRPRTGPIEGTNAKPADEGGLVTVAARATRCGVLCSGSLRMLKPWLSFCRSEHPASKGE